MLKDERHSTSIDGVKTPHMSRAPDMATPCMSEGAIRRLFKDNINQNSLIDTRCPKNTTAQYSEDRAEHSFVRTYHGEAFEHDSPQK